jgi:hypothetical protein
VVAEINTLCNYQSKVQTTYNDNKELIVVNGTAFFPGDLLEEIDEIVDGEVEIFNMKHKILRSTKARNIDGTVNFTKLELI